MPRRRGALLAAVAGLAFGVTGAVFLLSGNDTIAATSAPTTATASPVTVPPWVNRRETRLGPAVIIAGGLQMEGDRVLFTYSLQPISPRGGADAASIPPDEFPSPAAPASFTMTYAGGTSPARVIAPTQRAARFAVPPGFTLDQVQGISIDSYWVAAPARFPLELSPTSGAWVAAAPGLRGRILQVVEQASNRLVIVELEGDVALASDLSIAGEGRGWQSSSSSQLGSHRWTLDFRGAVLPDPVALVVRGIAWVEVPGGGPIDLEGIPR